MAHGGFEDAEVAELMNANYVCIKLDREERPDLDDIYMTALSMMGEQGGWPLTMFLDPDGLPFGARIFKNTAYGRPGFMQVLRELARVPRHRKKPPASRPRHSLGRRRRRSPWQIAAGWPHAPRPLNAHIDMAQGGLGAAQNFLNPFSIAFCGMSTTVMMTPAPACW